MEDQPKPKKKMTNVTYPKRLPAYDTEAGARIWREIARQMKCSTAAAIRRVAREEAARRGICVPENGECAE